MDQTSLMTWGGLAALAPCALLGVFGVPVARAAPAWTVAGVLALAGLVSFALGLARRATERRT